jgi:pimeloyl-ACP methyl ester carboxylesterase
MAGVWGLPRRARRKNRMCRFHAARPDTIISMSHSSPPTDAEALPPGQAPLGSPAAGSSRDEPSRLATLVGWVTLRLSNYPMRHWLGSSHRARSRGEGGYGFKVKAGDGVRLHVWHMPAEAGAPARLPIVMSHGWLEIKEFHFDRARALTRLGHDVILFDHRGHGRSDAATTSFGVSERRDLRAVLDASQRRGLIQGRAITVGFSMGAATCLQQAVDDPRIAGVVAFAPFVDLRQAIRTFRDKLAARVPDDWLLAGFEKATAQAGYQVDEASTRAAIERLTQPVLLVQAGGDRNLPPETHIEPLAAAKQQGTLQRFTVEEATHMTLCRSAWPGLDETVQRFCRELSDA